MTDLDHGADLRERIDRALTDLSAPEGLTESALTRGHRLRRRRRALTTASGVVAAAVVAALVFPGLDGGRTGSGPEIATQPSEPTVDTPSPEVEQQVPSLPPDGEPSFYEPPAGWWDVPSKELAAYLEDLLPEGVSVIKAVTVSKDVAPGEDPQTTGFVRATLEGDAGPGGLEILLYPPDPEEVPDPVTSTDANGDDHTTAFAGSPSIRSRTRCGSEASYADTCDEILSADGMRIGRVTSSLQDGKITFHEATLLGPRDGLIYMSAWNATDGKPGPGTRQSAPVPPLTLDQLRTLAKDPAWTSYQP